MPGATFNVNVFTIKAIEGLGSCGDDDKVKPSDQWYDELFGFINNVADTNDGVDGVIYPGVLSNDTFAKIDFTHQMEGIEYRVRRVPTPEVACFLQRPSPPLPVSVLGAGGRVDCVSVFFGVLKVTLELCRGMNTCERLRRDVRKSRYNYVLVAASPTFEILAKPPLGQIDPAPPGSVTQLFIPSVV